MVTSMDPVFRFLISGDLRWMLTGSEGCGDFCRARSGSSLPFSFERSSRLPWSAFLSSFCHKEALHSCLQACGLCPCCPTPAPGSDLLLCQAQEAPTVPAATLMNPDKTRTQPASSLRAPPVRKLLQQGQTAQDSAQVSPGAGGSCAGVCLPLLRLAESQTPWVCSCPPRSL